MTSKQIANIRAALGENTTEFGARLGVSKKAVEAWEYIQPPKKGPALILLEQLAREVKKSA